MRKTEQNESEIMKSRIDRAHPNGNSGKATNEANDCQSLPQDGAGVNSKQVEQVILKLVQMARDQYCAWKGHFEEEGVLDPIKILDCALDLMGVPDDNTTIYHEPPHFCRDWLWTDCQFVKMDAKDYVEWVKSEMRKDGAQ
jgi:hypothetical protein